MIEKFKINEEIKHGSEENPIIQKIYWKGSSRPFSPNGPQLTTVICNGEWHEWKDENGNEWVEKCPESKMKAMRDNVKMLIVDQIGSRTPLTFSNFDESYNSMVDHIEKIRAWICSKKRILWLCGESQTGKTHLAEAIMIDRIENFCSCFWTTSINLNKLLISESMRDEWAIRKMIDLWDSDYVFIDDIGQERKTESGIFVEQLHEILSNHPGRLCFTSNLLPSQLSYPETIINRLRQSSEIIPFSGLKKYRVY